MTEKMMNLIAELEHKVGQGKITETQLVIRTAAMLEYHIRHMEEVCAGCRHRKDNDNE